NRMVGARSPMTRDKVVLGYAGGLDTSVAIRWLQDRGLDVVALTVDVGQPGSLGAIKEKAHRLGAKAYVVDARREFAEQYVFPALAANAMYEGQYPLSTALARPLIGKHLVAVAQREGASFIAHGCTGKGNDQVRFDLCTTALAPDLTVIAPAREWGMTREEEIAYAKERGIPVPVDDGPRQGPSSPRGARLAARRPRVSTDRRIPVCGPRVRRPLVHAAAGSARRVRVVDPGPRHGRRQREVVQGHRDCRGPRVSLLPV